MHIGNGNRDGWEFEYTASKLAEGAAKQKDFRLGRVAWWTEAKAKVMAEVKESGLEVSESVAASISNYASTQMAMPRAGQSAYTNTKKQSAPRLNDYILNGKILGRKN